MTRFLDYTPDTPADQAPLDLRGIPGGSAAIGVRLAMLSASERFLS